MPDLPIPVRITCPLQSRTKATAAAKRSSSRSVKARTAAASVCRTFRARDRSGMRLRDPIKLDQLAHQCLDMIEAQRVACIALGAWRILMHLHEDGVDADSHAGSREGLDVFAEASRHAVTRPRQLQA